MLLDNFAQVVSLISTKPDSNQLDSRILMKAGDILINTTKFVEIFIEIDEI